MARNFEKSHYKRFMLAVGLIRLRVSGRTNFLNALLITLEVEKFRKMRQGLLTSWSFFGENIRMISWLFAAIISEYKSLKGIQN